MKVPKIIQQCMKTALCLAGGLFIVSDWSHAQATNLSTTTAISPPILWSGAASATVNTNMEEKTSEDHTFNSDYSLMLNRKISDHNLRLTLAATKDFKAEQKFEILSVGLGHYSPWALLGNTAKLRFQTQLSRPLDENKVKNETLNGSVTLTPNLTLNSEGLNLIGTTISYRPFLRQNFHQFTTSHDGRSNNNRTAGHRASVDFEISESFSINFTGSYQRNWTYSNVTTDSYSHDESINFQATKSISFSLGHSNDGSALALDGRSRNLEFSNIRNSIFYFSTDAAF